MAILAVASGKGGAGKTSLVVSLADYWSSRCGLKVAALDLDPNANLLDWIGDAGMPNVTCIRVTEDTVFDAAIAANTEHDIVLIDVAGVLSQGMLFAVGAADAVLIPANPSRPDIIEASRTNGVIDHAEKTARKHNPTAVIPRAVVLNRSKRREVMTAKAREFITAADLPLLDSDLADRVCFREAWLLHRAPLSMGDKDAVRDVETLAAEIAERLSIGPKAAKKRSKRAKATTEA